MGIVDSKGTDARQLEMVLISGHPHIGKENPERIHKAKGDIVKGSVNIITRIRSTVMNGQGGLNRNGRLIHPRE